MKSKRDPMNFWAYHEFNDNLSLIISLCFGHNLPQNIFWSSGEKYNLYPTKLWDYTSILNLLINSYTGYMDSMFGLGVFQTLS